MTAPSPAAAGPAAARDSQRRHTLAPQLLQPRSPGGSSSTSRKTSLQSVEIAIERQESVASSVSVAPSLMSLHSQGSTLLGADVEAAHKEWPTTLHEQVLGEVRRLSKLQAAALLLHITVFALAIAAAGGASDLARARLMSAWVAGVSCLALLVQIILAASHLRATDAASHSKRLAEMPPVHIPVDVSQPPLLQAISVLTKLARHTLTNGTPSSPRLVVQPVDATGAAVGGVADATGTFRSRTGRELVREPLAYAKAKIRSAAKDPRALKWEESLGLEQAETQRGGATPGGKDRRASDPLNQQLADSAVHGFLTANYGSALRHAAESSRNLLHRRESSEISPEKSFVRAEANAAGLAAPLEEASAKEAKELLRASTLRGEGGCTAESAWRFDAFAVARCTGDHGLLFVGYHCFQDLGLLSTFDIDRKVLIGFLRRMETAYNRNPYHNRDHAADVTQAAMWLLHAGTQIVSSASASSAAATSLRSQLEASDVMALLVASIAHDAQHTGQNNAFHVASSSELAIVYNDKSVLENHHCATLFAITKDHDIFAGMSVPQRREVRDLVVAMVLGTDMAVHFKNVDRLSATLSSGDLDLSKRDDKSFVLEMVIHSADVANPCREEPLYRQWTEKVMQEFYAQGDLEKEHGMPVSKFFDRSCPDVPKCQLGFINFVVAPLFAAMGEMLDLDVLTRNLNANREAMEKEAAAAATEQRA